VDDDGARQHGNSQPIDKTTISLAHWRSLASRLGDALVMAKKSRCVKCIDIAIANSDRYSVDDVNRPI
jgi:hypothetical protein